jgi:hypothetical protein
LPRRGAEVCDRNGRATKTGAADNSEGGPGTEPNTLVANTLVQGYAAISALSEVGSETEGNTDAENHTSVESDTDGKGNTKVDILTGNAEVGADRKGNSRTDTDTEAPAGNVEVGADRKGNAKACSDTDTLASRAETRADRKGNAKADTGADHSTIAIAIANAVTSAGANSDT